MSGVPRIVCWPRLGFGREATIAALKELDGIELRVALTLPEVLPLLHDADAMVLHSAPPKMARAVLDALAGGPMRWLHFLTAGRDGFEAAGLPRSYTVTQVPGASAPAVAEHAVALLLALGRRVPTALELARERRWDRVAMGRFVSLEGGTVAVIGAGAIGQQVAQRVRAFGATAIGVSRTGSPLAAFDAMQPVAQLRDVLARCGAVVVAVPLTDATKHLLDAAAFAALPKGAFVVNIARGAVIDQAALCAALESGHLGGAALDVTDPEPPAAEDRVWSCPNLILTPHVAVEGSAATVRRLAEATVENVRRFARGEPLLDVVSR